MKDIEIPRKWVDRIALAGTLGGIILGFDAIAQTVWDQKPWHWAVFGFFVSFVSAIGAYRDLLDQFGNYKTEKFRRNTAGLMSVLLFGLFAMIVVILWRPN